MLHGYQNYARSQSYILIWFGSLFIFYGLKVSKLILKTIAEKKSIFEGQSVKLLKFFTGFSFLFPRFMTNKSFFTGFSFSFPPIYDYQEFFYGFFLLVSPIYDYQEFLRDFKSELSISS